MPDLFGGAVVSAIRFENGEGKPKLSRPILDDRLKDQEAANLIVTHVFAREAARAAAGANRPLVEFQLAPAEVGN